MNDAEPGLGAMTSRRGALSAGGLALAGAVGPRSAPRSRVIFGSTLHAYPELHAAAPLAVGLRMYFNGENVFPAAWPDPYPGAWITLSLRPNPDDLFSGKLDEPLRAVIASAPAHAELTFWHENISGNPLGYPSYVNNALAAVRMQHYGQRLCRGTRVRFGAITCGPANQQIDWLAPGLDWYGDDLYEFPRLRGPDGTMSRAKIIARLNANLEAWRMKSARRWPAIRLCETNTPFDSHRKNWYTWIAHWMAGHNGRRMLTFWNPDAGAAQGGLSGPWPPSAAVIRRLRWLSEEYSGAGRQFIPGQAGNRIPHPVPEPMV